MVLICFSLSPVAFGCLVAAVVRGFVLGVLTMTSPEAVLNSFAVVATAVVLFSD